MEAPRQTSSERPNGMRPLVLLSNDDGVDAHGLNALRRALSRFATVVVCAPTSNQSAQSHALTLSTVLRLRRIDEATFALDGTPADCVYVALHSKDRLLSRWPDLVVSGMNHGPNLGVDVVYSGTVAAAREAAQRGIPAFAVSADMRAEAEAAAALAARVIEATWRRLLQPGEHPTPLFNINIPAGKAWRVVATRVGKRLYEDDVVYRNDPRGREYLWIGGSSARHDRTGGTDTDAWEAGHASLTPLSLDLFASDTAQLASAVAADTALVALEAED
jgi:5'-nucleotidase